MPDRHDKSIRKDTDMRYSEFADTKDHTLSPEDMAAMLKQLERIWHDYGIDDDSSFILRVKKQQTGKRRKSIDAV
jgi:hypothetical protein